ncbi:cell division protein FtsQ/DivIB [Salinispira pacifica]
MADQMLFTRSLTGEDTEPRRSYSAERTRPYKSTTLASEQADDGRTAGRRLLLWLAVGIAFAAGLVLLFDYVIGPRLVIRTFSVESDINVPREKILEIAGITGRPRFFDVDPGRVASRLEAWAPVKQATVAKVFPDTLRISVTGRKPIGMAMASENGKEFPVAFDDDGVVFASGPEVAAWDLPVFSGIAFKDFNLGVTLPPMLLEFVHEVKELKLSSPGLYDLISEYRIVPRNDHEFDVLVYPVHHRVAVEIGPHIDRTLCMYILRVLDVMDRQGTLEKVKEIDFRTSDVVYTMKEEG